VAGALGAAWVAYAWLPHLPVLATARRGPRDGRRVALTFDDGPDPLWTARIADILADANVRGTFFVIGERAVRAPGVVRALAAAGHEVGNHTWSHRSFWLSGPRRTCEEIERAHAVVAELTGRAPRLFRPPWGHVNAAMFGALRRCGERCVLWSIQPEGLRPRDPDRQVEHVLARGHPGAIVDLHDADGVPGAPARLAAALPAMIDGLRAAGYDLVTASELLAPVSVSFARRARPRRR
jgi:peptidoglycan/xylan/chitin deacetylase (PgdA/CDA1 family)